MTSIRKKTVLIVTLLLTLSASASQGGEATTKPVDFSRDIQPILSNHCYACHGPDAKSREAGPATG